MPGEVVDRATGSSLSLRDEKILLTLVVQTQQLNDRITHLEDRFDASVRDSLSQPDHDDLLELRMHSARLAAELSRVTIELRAEINDLASGLADPPGSERLSEPATTAADDEGDVIDLRPPLDTSTVRAPRSAGWRPARRPPPPNDER